MIVCHYDREITRPLLLALPSILPEHSTPQQQKNGNAGYRHQVLGIRVLKNRLGKPQI